MEQRAALITLLARMICKAFPPQHTQEPEEQGNER